MLRNNRNAQNGFLLGQGPGVRATRSAFISLALTVLMWTLAGGLGLAKGIAAEGQASDVEALMQAGHWKRARALVEPRVKANPQDPRASDQLAEVKMSFDDLDGALPLAQHAVELDGKNSNDHLILGQIYGEMASRANMFAAGSLALKFRKEVEVAIQLDPSNLDALDSMMQFKFQAPGLMGGSKDEAHALAEKISQLNASEGYLAHAALASLEKNPAQMEENLLKAVQADPKNYEARMGLARFYSQPAHTKFEEAAMNAQAALLIDPGRIGAYWILARIAALQGKWGDLEQTLSTAEKAVPDDLRPYYEAALALADTGKELPRAEGYARKYLGQEPEGDEPGKAEAHRVLGLVFEKEGRKNEALAEIHTAIQLKPNFKAAKEDLKRLE